MEIVPRTPSYDAYGPSLLPWLQPPAGSLRLCLSRTGDGWFPELTAPAPLTRRLAATIGVSDHALLRIDLIMQPDHYLAPAGPAPINPDIETLWHQTLDRHRALHPAGLPAAPACQLQQGRWRPFRPIWYCRQTGRFAHALCPVCGRGLHLCRDDALLARAGLPEYSRSPARYLHCPVCPSEGQPEVFYTSGIVGARPAGVQDSRELAAGFGRLLMHRELGPELPCVGCSEADACFGPGQAVLARLQPLCFYPFYMLIQPAPAFDATAFMALLADTARQSEPAEPARLPEADLDRQLGVLREELHGGLGAGKRPNQTARPVDSSTDHQIALIVADVLTQWPAGMPATAGTPPAREADGDVAETIILRAPAPPPEPLKEAPPAPQADQTVILTAPGDLSPEEPDLAATILQHAQAPPPPPEADLSETVVLTRTTGGVAGFELEATVMVNSGLPGSTDDELEKTVIFPSADRARAGAQEPYPPAKGAEEDLEATVVLNPSGKIKWPGKPHP
jgi:hypothetical protein